MKVHALHYANHLYLGLIKNVRRSMIIITSKEQQDQRVYNIHTGKYTSLFYFLEIKSSEFLRPAVQKWGVGIFRRKHRTSWRFGLLA